MKFFLMLMVVAIQCTSSTFITSGVHFFVRVHHMPGCLHTTRPVSFRTSNAFPFFLGELVARVCGSYIPIASRQKQTRRSTALGILRALILACFIWHTAGLSSFSYLFFFTPQHCLHVCAVRHQLGVSNRISAAAVAEDEGDRRRSNLSCGIEVLELCC